MKISRKDDVAGILRNSLIVGMLVIIVLGSIPLPSVVAQGVAEDTILRRDLVIDLDDGLTTDAQLTFPAVGSGPFAGILLVHGSGPMDMDGYVPPEVAGGKPARLYLQQAEYLSERGFAVLRYNKRGVGLNDTILDLNVWRNITFQDLVRDAEKAVAVLRQQPEVDATDITIIGHSEGTLIAPRIAIKDPTIRNIVLLSAAAHSVHDIVYWQIVVRNIFFAENLFDTNHDGLLSIQEALEAQRREELPPQSLVQNATGEYDWIPGIDANNDGYFSIHEEWEPILIQAFDIITTSDPESPFYDKWLQSQLALEETNLDLIGNVSASILILNGENDIQTPVEEAFLLEQKLIETEHPDHTVITYPGLGHSFHPARGLNQPLGPIEEHVLADLAAWLKDPARNVRYLKAEIETASDIIEALQSQLTNVNSELELRTSELQDAEKEISVLKDDLEASDQEISSLEAELTQQTQNVERLQDIQTEQTQSITMLQDIQKQLTNDLEAANQEIVDQESQLKILQTKSSRLENTVAQLQDRTSELQTALEMSTALAYIAIVVAVIAVIGAYTIRIRRKR